MISNKNIEIGDDVILDEFELMVSSVIYANTVLYEIHEYKDNCRKHIAEIPQPLLEKQQWMFEKWI